MNATKSTELKPDTKPVRTFRERTHRLSKLPIKDLLKTRMAELELKNSDVAAALGYPQPNVIAMIKSGSMRLPHTKAVPAARILQVDPAFLLGKIISEGDASLWDQLEGVMGNRLVSQNELDIIKLFREELDGFDVDLAKNKEFVRVIRPVLQAVMKREKAVTEAVKDRVERSS